MTLPGVDVASFQGTPGQWQGEAGSIAWAAVKITEYAPNGVRYVNPDAQLDWDALGAAGLVRVGYLFGHPSMSATQTVAFFLGTLNGLGIAGGDAVALDLEVTNGLGPAAVAAWAGQVLTALKRELDREPLLYTFTSFAQEGNCAGLGSYPLWIADPSSPAGQPYVPPPWRTAAIHQYQITGNIDRDVALYPSAAAMRKALGKTIPTPPAPAAPWKGTRMFFMLPALAGPTPVAVPTGVKKLVLTPTRAGLEVGVQIHDHGTTPVKLDWQPEGWATVPVPAGVQGILLHRLDHHDGTIAVEFE